MISTNQNKGPCSSDSSESPEEEQDFQDMNFIRPMAQNFLTSNEMSQPLSLDQNPSFD